MFDKDGGRIIYFEGTYTTTFSGNPRPDPAVRLQPGDVPARPVRSAAGASGGDLRGAIGSRRDPTAGHEESSGGASPVHHLGQCHFLHPERPGIASLPVYEQWDPQRGQTLLVVARVSRPNQVANGRCFIFFRLISKTTRRRPFRFMSTAKRRAAGGIIRSNRRRDGSLSVGSALLGRVWRNPGRSRLWGG